MPSLVATAIIGSSALGAGASLIGSGQQASAANNAAALQDRQYQQTRADYEPWRVAGGNAVTRQADVMGLNGADQQQNAFASFRTDPSYNFVRDQAIQGIDRSAAARGLLHSGATIKAIQDRASSLADGQYTNWFNRLASIAGTGQTATGSTAAAGSSAAANMGDAMMAAGNARASGYSGVAQSLNQGAQGYLTNNYFNRLVNGPLSGSTGNALSGSTGNGGLHYTGDGNGEFWGL